jgi:hypothetical protein
MCGSVSHLGTPLGRGTRKLREKKEGDLMRERRGAPLSDVSAWAVLVLVLIAHGASVCNGGMSTWRHARGGSVAAAVCQRRSGVPHLQALRLMKVKTCGRATTSLCRRAREFRCIAVRIQGFDLGARVRVFGSSFLRSVVYSGANACVLVGRLV